MTWQHTGLAGSGSGGLAVKFADGGNISAFAWLRVAEPFTLYDSKQVWNDGDIANNAENYPLFYDNQQTSGGGTTTAFNVNRASTILGVAATTAGSRVRQSKQRFNYQPGKGQLVIVTALVGTGKAGITKRLGYFDDNNGVFFEQSGSTLSVGVRSFVSGSAIDTTVNQSDWNLDTLNGNGASGVNLDLSKVQIFFCDFEWLGVGRIRFGFYIDGLPVYCHEVLNSNVIGSVYMSTPNLPIRVEITNDGSGVADTIEHICSTVVSEGGLQPNGTSRWSDIGAAAAEDITAGTIGTSYVICGLRLKQNYLSADVRIEKISVIENSGANNPFIWKLHLNPTLTVGLSWADVSNSAVQFGTGAPAGDALTDDGTILAGGYQSRNDATASVAVDTALRLGALIDNTADILVISGTPITQNQLYFGGVQWREAW